MCLAIKKHSIQVLTDKLETEQSNVNKPPILNV